MGRRIGHRSDVYDTCDLLRSLVFRQGASGVDIVDTLCEIGLTRDDMLETLTDTVYKGDEGQVALDTKTKGAITREWKKREVNWVEAKKVVDNEDEDVVDNSDEDDAMELL